MIDIPHKTLSEIDVALSAPNLEDLRRSLSKAAQHMRPLEKLAKQGRQIDLSNRHRFNLGSPR